MKVKKEIIANVKKVLELKGDTISLEQLHVIEEGWTEHRVFVEYVSNLGEEERNQDVYFACRDAALFLAGKLPASAIASELTDEIMLEEDDMPDNDDSEEDDDDEEKETITLSRTAYDELIERIEKLEYWCGLKRRPKRRTLPPLPVDAKACEYIIQKEAADMLGLSKNGIRGYIDRGELDAWQDGRSVKLKKCDVVKLMKNRKNVNNHE